MKKKNEKKILGVCAWISEKFNVPVLGVRAFFAVVTILGFGSPVIVYLLLYFLMPKGS